MKPYVYYANRTAPAVPARFGVQSISGLSDVDRFFTQAQLDCGTTDDAVINPLCVDVRGGGYFPSDLQGLYDITGHGYDGTGQTIGFTLWTAAERQSTMTAFATATGDQLITIDPNCVASGNSPTTPSSCTTQTVGPDHLLFILENGNLDNNFGSNVETALDIESAHGVATHVGMKYYAADCATTTPPGSGLTNAGCNGSDVGLLETMEDAANDPTLHSVSNSWAFGGEAEWGAADPFLIASENSLTIAAAAGTTFYFSTGDSGTYQSGYPSDSPHVVGVGGTSTYSTSNPATWSTSTTWSGGGSWCSNVFARPSWQTGAGVSANAPCPGRASRTSPRSRTRTQAFGSSRTRNAAGTNTQNGQVGGTSLAAPVMNGLQAVTQNFVAAQTYSGPKPQLGFVGADAVPARKRRPLRELLPRRRVRQHGEPDERPGRRRRHEGLGRGDRLGRAGLVQLRDRLRARARRDEPEHAGLAVAALQLGLREDAENSTVRSIACPSVSTCYAVGNPSGATPWYGKFLPSGAWGAVNTFLKSSDGGASWFPSNSDMFSIACTSSSTCIEVGAGGRERRTTDGGDTGPTSRRRRTTTSRSRRSRARRARSATRSAIAATR